MSASTCEDTDFGNLPGCECCGAPVYREGVLCGQCASLDWRAPSVVDVMGDDILWCYRSGELVAASCGGEL
jgi:hypothetical protein